MREEGEAGLAEGEIGERVAGDPGDALGIVRARLALEDLRPMDEEMDFPIGVGMPRLPDEGADVDADAQLLEALPGERRIVGLAGLDLAPGELPEAALRLVERPLLGQDRVLSLEQRRDDPELQGATSRSS